MERIELGQDRGRDRDRVAGRARADGQHRQVVTVPAPGHDQLEARAGLAAERSQNELAFSIGMIHRLQLPVGPAQPVLGVATAQLRLGRPEGRPPWRIHSDLLPVKRHGDADLRGSCQSG